MNFCTNVNLTALQHSALEVRGKVSPQSECKQIFSLENGRSTILQVRDVPVGNLLVSKGYRKTALILLNYKDDSCGFLQMNMEHRQ